MANFFGLGGGGNNQSQGQGQQNQNEGGAGAGDDDPKKGTPGEQAGGAGESESGEEEFSLTDLFAEDDESDDDPKKKEQGQGSGQGSGDGGEGGGKKEATEEDKVTQEIQGIIQGLKPADDLLPDDFDPSDPKQFRDAMSSIQQQTAMATIQATLKPMQLAMKSLAADMRTEIQSALQNHSSSSQARQALESIVPEAADPELKGLVDNVWNQAQKKYKKPAEAARATRKALDAMGIKSKSKGGQGGGDPSEEGSSFLSGEGALDHFAPMPKG